ncbi:MAG: GNAT family protein [Vulcanimicrobiota bacterium]
MSGGRLEGILPGEGKSEAMIATSRLHLWSLERHDLMKNYHWANQRQLIRWTGMHPFPKTAGELERWFENLGGRQDMKIFAIKTKDSEYVGNIELRDIDWITGKAEVGVFLAEPEARGLGLGREALRGLTEFAFLDLRLHRLYAKILESNQAAQRAFEACGFLLEGRERQSHFDQGRHWDVLVYGLLEPEWKEKRNATH